MKFDLEKFKQNKSESTSGRTLGLMLEQNCEKVFEKIQNITELSTVEDTMALISGLCQTGGTNRNAGLNVAFTYNDKNLSALDFQKVCKDQGQGTARQFARTMNNTIYQFAEILDVEGDLSRQMRLDHPTMTKQEAIWCSNFQSENSACPEIVRNWLKQDLKSRFKN